MSENEKIDARRRYIATVRRLDPDKVLSARLDELESRVDEDERLLQDSHR